MEGKTERKKEKQRVERPGRETREKKMVVRPRKQGRSNISNAGRSRTGWKPKRSGGSKTGMHESCRHAAGEAHPHPCEKEMWACSALTHQTYSPTSKAKASAPSCEQNPSGITHLQHKTKVFKDSDRENSKSGLGI